MAARLTIKDPYLEKRIFQGRLLWIGGLMILMTVSLVSRYFYLQITQHETFSTRAEANRILTLPLPPTRGLILDRDGEIQEPREGMQLHNQGTVLISAY